MIVSGLPSGRHHKLRMVTKSDAEFMVWLRRHPTAAIYMHETSSDVSMQQRWIEEKRHSEDDITLILEEISTGRCLGFVSLYEFDDERRVARYGRLLTIPHSRCVPEFTLLVLLFVFEILHLDSVYAKVVAENRAINRFLSGMGHRRTDLDDETTIVRGERHRLVKYEVDQEMWPDLKMKLEELVGRMG